MKKKIVVFLLMLVFVAGSSSAAIVITDQAGLQAIGTDATTLAGDYVLGNDITLTGPFTSIMEFTGTFDGQMHTISGLTKTVVGTRASGIFGRTVAGSEIRNVGMTNVSLTSDGESPNYVAALINDSKGTVEKCWLESVIGPAVENHSLFPNRTNVHFVRIDTPSEFTMRTWERGSGITMACGTGACACAVASVLNGRQGRVCTAHLPGGDLELNWCEEDNCVYMTGPATEVFDGCWPAG